MTARRHHWQLQNLVLFAVGVAAAWLLTQTPGFREFLSNLGAWGHLGTFLAGTLFSSVLTVPIATTALLALGKYLPLWELSLVGGMGAMVGDLVILYFIRDGLFSGLKVKPIRPRHFGWLIPLVGAIIIASPLPDELGISLLGLGKIRPQVFMIISFCLNALGIFISLGFLLILYP